MAGWNGGLDRHRDASPFEVSVVTRNEWGDNRDGGFEMILFGAMGKNALTGASVNAIRHAKRPLRMGILVTGNTL